MPNPKGLWRSFCPSCKTVTPQRTLNVKVESEGKPKWHPIYRLCMACNSFNPIVYPRYTLIQSPGPLPTPLAQSVVNQLRGGSFDLPQILARLRHHPEARGHVFKSEVLMTLEYLERKGLVSSSEANRTEETIGLLRSRGPFPTRHGPCPLELENGVVSRSLVSLYFQARLAGSRKFVPRGWLCLNCGCHEMGSIPTV